MIPEGRPARLYLDVEYPTALNPDKDAAGMMRALKQSMEAAMRQRGIAVGGWVELESSTSTKFSRHLIMPEVCGGWRSAHVLQVVFADNAQMGAFMHGWAEQVCAACAVLSAVCCLLC